MNERDSDEQRFSTSQKFVHIVAMIAGVLVGSGAGFAVPQLVGVSTLPEAVEALQDYAARGRQRTMPAVQPERPPAATPSVADPPRSAPQNSPTGDAPFVAPKTVPEPTPRPVRSSPKIETADETSTRSITIDQPVAPSVVTAAPQPELVAAAATQPTDTLMTSTIILSPDVSERATLGLNPMVDLSNTAVVPLPRARPDDIPGPSPAERLSLSGPGRVKAERCLANAIYFEARNQPVRGQIAVAQVIINRAFSPYYPNDICGVVYQGSHRHLSCQFTFACDSIPDVVRDRGAWALAQRLSRQILNGKIWLPEVAKSTHYHAAYVRPYWVREMRTLARHGLHTFYRPRRWGDGREEPSWGAPASKKART